MTTIPFQAFKLAVQILNFERLTIAGSRIAESYPVEGRILVDHGFLSEGEISTLVPNRHTWDGDFVEPEWNEETRTYQYFSFDDGMWVDVPEEDLKTYNLDVERVVHHLHDLAGLDGEPRGIRGNLLWNLGTFWLGRRKIPIFLARRLSWTDCFDEIFDTLKRLGAKTPGAVLAWGLPQGRHVELPNGNRMVNLKEAVIVEGDGYRLDMEMVKGILTGASNTRDDLAPVQWAADYSTVRVNGREYVFTGLKQKQVIGLLVEAWQRGEAKCRTPVVLEEVEAASSSNTIAKLFSGRSDWKELIGYGDGFCWLKV